LILARMGGGNSDWPRREAHSERGLARVLGVAAIYSGLQRALGVERLYRRIAEDYLRLRPGDRLLDIGCGPASILDVLPRDVSYAGFDPSPDYIEAARRRYGTRGEFWATRVSDAAVAELPPFDVVLAFSVLHHLDDGEAAALVDLAWRALKPGGRLVTYDPCFVAGQHPIARYLIRRDRGRHVRTPEGYRSLARRRFEAVEGTTLEGHLRVPYTAFVLCCPKPLEPTRDRSQTARPTPTSSA
jgi:SAM-dependent methyltransferase